MNSHSSIPIGTCTFGPVILSQSTTEEDKFSVAIIDYDKSRHYNLITCKTTSQNHHKVWPGEFIVSDLFGRGPTKVQPYNIIRITKPRLVAHSHIGRLHSSYLPEFELGLKLAIKQGLLDPKETLDLADSWKRFFTV